MESLAPYRATFIAMPPSDVLPATTSLEVAMQQLTSRLRLTATTAGLPDLSLTTITNLRTQGPSTTCFLLHASAPGLDWSKAAVSVSAPTLDEVEIRFLDALAEYAYHQLDQVHAQEPRLFGNQQLASTLALAEAA